MTSIGDIALSPTTVFLPSGRHPLKGSAWTVQDLSHTEEKVSTVGIVLAILFVWFCLLGLLFLLMKERRTVGFVQVTVQGPGFHHQSMIPSQGPQTFVQVQQSVAWARSHAV